ncbi:molybdenum ABC transporter membrane protein [Jeotgalibacillus alimentarius]|uniref:Molybdenum transport system permease n=1 Tax=Jeotgalibacillus alimentarius TaxID=135826 RepID=A0A0C2RMF3_9BACL|nr:molybdate ABC transporter permease subunit [Jeotgalibacillus alimentarius]KIL51430.1 molybdenum ABC transporter membrane protein [Jeotgalibacillus alimentarius]
MPSDFWSPLRLSLEIATAASLVVLILGLIAGRIMTNRQFRGKPIIETIFLLPLVLPPTVVGFLLIVIFGRNSPAGQFIEWLFQQPIIFTWWAAMIAAVVVAFPLMYQSAKTGFESIDEDIERAARVDGAGEWKLFLLVSIPLAWKAIIAGFILSFARALGEFGATLMFAGNIPGRTQTASTAIYLAIESGNMQMAWLWVASMVGISFVMLVLVQGLRR